MKLNRFELAGILASLCVVILAAVFFVSQGIAHANVDPCVVPGMGMFGCESNEGNMNVPVDPCDITPCGDDEPSLGEQITCAVYEELMAQGEPIPQDFDTSACDDDNGGGGGNEEPTDVCSNIDGVQTEVPSGKVQSGTECVDAPSEGGGGGGSSGGSSSGGGGGGGGSAGGTVLGTTTPTVCEPYITTFMRQGQANDVEQVKRMQSILKMFEGMDVEETGEYDAQSVAAVNAFQHKYADEVLIPWGIQEPTGYVFLTTRKKLNEVYCKNTQVFPLTEEEAAHIESLKNVATVKPVAAAAAAMPEKVLPVVEVESVLPVAIESEAEAETPVRGNRITDFFRRLFDRFR